LSPCGIDVAERIGRERLEFASGQLSNSAAARQRPRATNLPSLRYRTEQPIEEATMGFGRGALLWLLGIPLPIIILLALFWHH
jgi:hypothetical protein